jgi:hypothetical protein
LDQRPKDFGSIKPGDVGDTPPIFSDGELKQIDYELDQLIETNLSDDTGIDESNFFTDPTQGYLPTLVARRTYDKNRELFRAGSHTGYVVQEYSRDHLAEFLPAVYHKDLPIYYAKILLSNGREIFAKAFDQTVRVNAGDRVLVFVVSGSVQDITYDDAGTEKKIYIDSLEYIKPTNARPMDVE